VLLAKKVRIGKDKIPGVIGATPPHLLKEKERDKVCEIDSLYIDIGVSDKEEAVKYVTIGDYVEFDTQYHDDGTTVFAKALDDRIGCAILIRLLKKGLPSGVVLLFSVQEEVGLRGAKVVAEQFEPELFISVEATGAGDFPTVDGEPGWPRSGSGPAITVADRSLIVPQEIINLLVDAAETANVPYQFKRPLIGGTDAGMVSIAKAGIKAGVVSVPVRYIHSPIGTVKTADIDNTEALLSRFVMKVAG
jgi:endoglucanase